MLAGDYGNEFNQIHHATTAIGKETFGFRTGGDPKRGEFGKEGSDQFAPDKTFQLAPVLHIAQTSAKHAAAAAAPKLEVGEKRYRVLCKIFTK